MVGADWCDKCRQAKQIIQELGLWAQVQFIDFDDPEGKELAARYQREQIPFFVVGDELIEYVGQFLHVLTEARLIKEFGLEEADLQ
jgi:thiol-disulfide isomerase/thioredoxin